MPAIRSVRFRALLFLGVVVGVGACLVVARHRAWLEATLWSAVMLASFVGWGSLVNRWLAPSRTADVGLRAGWGLAFYVLTGGFLCFAHIAVRPVIVAHVGLGVAALIATDRRWRLPSWRALRRRALLVVARSGSYAVLAGVWGGAALIFFGFIGYHWFNPSDDLPFYLTLAEKLVQTSSLFEPFAARRVATFGAQVYLHASFIAVAPVYYLNAVDGGVAFVVTVALLVGHVTRGGVKAWHALPLGLAALLLFSLLEVRLNTNSQTSGLAAVLTLYRSVRAPFGADRERPLWPLERRRVVLLACLTLAAILLRISNAPPVLAFVGLIFASDYVLGAREGLSRESLSSLLKTSGLFVATMLLAFLPWSILQWQSSGTFFYPLGHSNITAGWTLLVAPRDWGEEATQLLEHLFYGRPVAVVLPFAVAGLLPLEGRARNDLIALSLATLVGMAAFSHQAVAFGTANTSRYYYASVAGMALLVAASVERTGARAALVAAALAMHMSASREETKAMLERYVGDAHGVVKAPTPQETEFEAATDAYRELQSQVPAGATMATAVYESFRFDFKRNRIFALDVLGGMGPGPGWPAHKGPEALGTYLKDQGVQYLAWVDFNLPSEFYGRAHWAPFVNADHSSYLQGQAVLQLDAEDAIEKLSALRKVVYKGHGMTVIDLASPAGGTR